MKKILIAFIVFSASYNVYCQNKTVTGRVISEDLETLPQISIIIKDTIEIGRTDVNGFFRIDIPVSEKRILFGFSGLEETTIELVDKCDKVEIVMMYIHTYDFITLKRAERKRKRRYKKLPDIHKQAFDKGVFETESVCYNREFKPFYLQE
jgi:hypothetical protein